MPTVPPPAIPAATLVIFRERDGAPPELLIAERTRAMAFAPGALVFPGGRVDPGDHALAATLDGDPDNIAAKLAAIRETIEETGLAIGLTPPSHPDAMARMRARLHAGASLGAVLSDAGVAPDLDALVPFARWRPDHRTTRVFDTRFYLARLPAGAPSPSVDKGEHVRLFWATAADVLAEADAGRATIIYPTRRNLERLARFASFDAAVADARAHPIATITPRVERRDGVDHLVIPAGLGYPVLGEPLAAARRG